MIRIWFWRPCWYWFGWRTLLPWYVGGDEYGRRTLMLGWTVTGRAIAAISRPGRLYRPESQEFHDPLTDSWVRASIYPHGGGVQRHGIQLMVARAESPDVPVAVLRLPADQVRQLGELVAASQRLVWRDPRNGEDQFWNPQD